MAGRTFVDTNVLLYAFDSGDPVRRRAALEVLRGIPPRGLVLGTQVLQEFYWNATRKLRPPLPRPEAARIVADLALQEVVVPDPAMVLRAAVREEEEQVAFWDALIVEAALEAGCTRLLTEDLQHGRRFGDLVVENPFADPGGGPR